MRNPYQRITRADFKASEIPNKVKTTDWLYTNSMVKAIMEGFANGCDYVTALNLFTIAKDKDIFEHDVNQGKYRIKRAENGTT